jgi:hypothetical protein
MTTRIFTALALLACTFVAIPNNSYGQVSISKFISSASEEFEVKTFDAQSAYLNTKPYRLSPLKELEYRHTNYELLDVHNRMGVRLTPANPWEMRANKQYFQNFQSTVALQRELAFKEAIMERYQAVVDYLYYYELKNLHAAGTKLLQDQLSILHKQSGSGLFDADQFARLKVEELDYQIDAEEVEYERAGHIHYMESILTDVHEHPVSWTPADLISVAALRSVIDSMVTASVKSTLVAYEQQKIRTAQSQYKAEKYDWNVGFIQGTYDQWRNEQGDVPLILSFGVSIPLTNPNKPEMARRKLDVIEAEFDLKESDAETNRDRIIFQDRLVMLMNHYDKLERQVNDLKSGNLAQSLSRIKGGDPLVFVQVNQRIAKMEVLLLKIKREIYTSYVNYLTFTDRIQRGPLVNFLLPGFPAIED